MIDIQRAVYGGAESEEGLEVAEEAFWCELRIVRASPPEGLHVPRGDDRGALVGFLFELIRGEPVEVFGAVYFGRGGQIVGYTMPYRGTTSAVGPEKRHLILKAWGCQARSMVVFHNHPTGDPAPSRSDLAWTRDLVRLAAPMGVEVRDHLVLGEEPRYCSMAKGRRVHGLGVPPGELWSWEEGEWIGRESRAPKRRRRAIPKYFDPQTGETWAGRGTMATWLQRRLEEGHELEDFAVSEEEGRRLMVSLD